LVRLRKERKVINGKRFGVKNSLKKEPQKGILFLFQRIGFFLFGQKGIRKELGTFKKLLRD